MTLENRVWSIMQTFRMDELIASRTSYKSVLRKVIPRSRAYAHERFEYHTHEGVRMVLDRGDYSQWRIFAGGLRINTNIFSYVPVNPYRFELIDIGANVGGYTVLFSHEIDVENFNVHLFEPNPLIIERLNENVALLEQSNLSVGATINPYALGPSEGNGLLRINEEHSGVSTMGNSSRNFASAVEVPVATLDHYVSEKHLDHIDLIKLDVEGFEPGVIGGARETLSRIRPALYFEYQREWFDNYTEDYVTDITDFLVSIGYSFYREERDGSLQPFQISNGTLQGYRHLNILAVQDQSSQVA